MNFKDKIIYSVIIALTINTSYVFAEKSNSIKNEINENKDKIQSLEEEKSNINNQIEKNPEFAKRLYYEKCPKKSLLEYIEKRNPDVAKEIKDSKK